MALRFHIQCAAAKGGLLCTWHNDDDDDDDDDVRITAMPKFYAEFRGDDNQS